MSFHGGVIGVIIAMLIFSYRRPKNIKEKITYFWKDFLSTSDQVTSILPIGLGLGRIGNYLNGELL